MDKIKLHNIDNKYIECTYWSSNDWLYLSKMYESYQITELSKFILGNIAKISYIEFENDTVSKQHVKYIYAYIKRYSTEYTVKVDTCKLIVEK